MLITDEYRRQNEALHANNPSYGTSGWQYARAVARLCQEHGTRDVLDYGAGKGSLGARLRRDFAIEIREYDPAIPGIEARPDPADIVCCGDVLEHIEPECLEAVLDDVRRLTRVAAYFVIATRPAAKTLPDGRNCHLIIESCQWWVNRLNGAGFDIEHFRRGSKAEAIFTVSPR